MIEDFDHILKTTRSVRRRLDLEREVPDEIIEACIEAAVQAPVGLGGENWRFLIVKEQKIRTEIANHYADIMQDLANQRGIEIKSTHRSLPNHSKLTKTSSAKAAATYLKSFTVFWP